MLLEFSGATVKLLFTLESSRLEGVIIFKPYLNQQTDLLRSSRTDPFAEPRVQHQHEFHANGTL
jgi:hypothetical protein